MLEELSSLIDNKEFYDQILVKKAGVRAVRIWGDTTVLEERKDTLKKLKIEIGHKEVTTHTNRFTDNIALVYAQLEKVLELILSTATFPVEDIKSDPDQPCLLVTCPTIQLAVKLIQHTVKTLGKIDAESAIRDLVKQGIEDQRVSVIEQMNMVLKIHICILFLCLQLAAVAREMSRLNVIDEEQVEDVIYSCSSEGLLQSCAELLRIAPNPRSHPIMEILEV